VNPVSDLTKGRLVAFFVLLAILCGLSLVAVSGVRVVTDMSFFLPAERTAHTQVLTVGMQRPGSFIMIRVTGSDPKDLVRASDHITKTLRDNPAFVQVQNGRPFLSPDIQAFLLEHRYLLGPDISPSAFSTRGLQDSITDSISRLSTVTGWAFRDIFPRDPTGRLRQVVSGLQWQEGPDRVAGIWQDAQGRALILARLQASAGDLSAQSVALDAIGQAVEQAGLTWEASGPGLFGLRASQRIQGDMTVLTSLAGGAVAFILFVAFRSIGPVLLAGLPVCLGILVGALVTQALFGSVHGVALTFGAVLSGVAVDYPIHLIGLRQPGDTARTVARRISRPMIIGAGTTAVGLLALTQSSFPGLAQIGTLAAVGVVTALLCTLVFLPYLVGNRSCSPNPGYMQVIWRWLCLRPNLRGRVRIVIGIVFLIAFGFALKSTTPIWETDLSRLNVAQEEERSLDAALRLSFKLPDVRQMLLIEGPDAQSVMDQQATLLPLLDKAVADGQLGRYFAAATILPTQAAQRARQVILPGRGDLNVRLEAATQSLPVSAATFAPFINDVFNQKSMQTLDPDALLNSPLGPYFLAPWPVSGGYAGIIALSPPIQLQDPRLTEVLVDLVQVAGQIIADYRDQAVTLLLIGLGIGMVMLVFGLRHDARRVIRVALPPVGAVVLTATLLLAFNVPLNLFHVLAFLLIASVGVDYSLFFPAFSNRDPLHAPTTITQATAAFGFRSVTVCCITTVTVFGILSISSIPVLSAIGMTVALGAGLSYLLTVFCAE
jgi:predicted exporter